MTGDALVIPAFPPGTRLFDRLSLICPVGAGTLSAVWFARDEARDCYVALKLFPPLLATDLALVEDLHREMARSRACPQPAAVEIYDVVWDDTLLGVLCEHVEGETFTERRATLPGGVLQPSQMSGWIVQLCAALETLHADGRVHGDLHPGCLMAEISGRLRILDFGIARPLAESVRLAALHSRYGALPFQSPQRREGGPVLRSDDLFAVGATLYDLLAGRPPAFDPSPPRIAAQRAQLGIAGEPVPQKWEEAIAACLANDPAERPASAAHLAGLLGLSVTPAPATSPVPPPAPPVVEPVSVPESDHDRTSRRYRSTSRFTWTLFWLAAFGSLAAVSRLAYVLTKPAADKQPGSPLSRGKPGLREPPAPEPGEGRAGTAIRDAAPAGRAPDELPREELEWIGKRIWMNECAGTDEGLTSWNKGEAFASIGIGHFIWYPEGVTGPFKESFPMFIDYLKQLGYAGKIPAVAVGACPWRDREKFLAEFENPTMKELRGFLKETFEEQARFLARRLAKAITELKVREPAKIETVQRRYRRLAESRAGMFAMIDYVNFKGEGMIETEQHGGKGWGLVQVLQEMKDDKAPVAAFSTAAVKVLEDRVANAPAANHEERWLAGWKSRVRSYRE